MTECTCACVFICTHDNDIINDNDIHVENMRNSFCKKWVCVLLVLTFFAIRPFVLFTMDIVFHFQRSVFCLECNKRMINDSATIPHQIHQIFFNVTYKPMPLRFKQAMDTWKNLNPSFKYIVWNESLVEQLLSTKYPGHLNTYHSYSHWVQRVDLAKYVILHHYGGILVDVDIECAKTMRDFLGSLPTKTGFVTYWTRPFGVSNDFITSKPNHPFITSVVTGLIAANRWYLIPYLTPLFSTGPVYVYGRYLEYKSNHDTDDILILKSTKSIIKHLEGATWHSLDGKTIWWLYVHREAALKCVFIIIFLLFMTWIVIAALRRRRSISRFLLHLGKCSIGVLTMCILLFKSRDSMCETLHSRRKGFQEKIV